MTGFICFAEPGTPGLLTAITRYIFFKLTGDRGNRTSDVLPPRALKPKTSNLSPEPGALTVFCLLSAVSYPLTYNLSLEPKL